MRPNDAVRKKTVRTETIYSLRMIDQPFKKNTVFCREKIDRSNDLIAWTVDFIVKFHINLLTIKVH